MKAEAVPFAALCLSHLRGAGYFLPKVTQMMSHSVLSISASSARQCGIHFKKNIGEGGASTLTIAQSGGGGGLSFWSSKVMVSEGQISYFNFTYCSKCLWATFRKERENASINVFCLTEFVKVHMISLSDVTSGRHIMILTNFFRQNMRNWFFDAACFSISQITEDKSIT